MRLVRGAADAHEMPMPVASRLRDRLLALAVQGHGEFDWTGIGLAAARDKAPRRPPELPHGVLGSGPAAAAEPPRRSGALPATQIGEHPVIPSLQEAAALRIDAALRKIRAGQGGNRPARSPSRQARAVAKPLIRQGRRGGRVAEGDGLLNRYTVINRIVGSNPIPSANAPYADSLVR
jgi:hypothetical protein